MYSINKSEGLPGLATIFSAAANVTNKQEQHIMDAWYL